MEKTRDWTTIKIKKKTLEQLKQVEKVYRLETVSDLIERLIKEHNERNKKGRK